MDINISELRFMRREGIQKDNTIAFQHILQYRIGDEWRDVPLVDKDENPITIWDY